MSSQISLVFCRFARRMHLRKLNSAALLNSCFLREAGSAPCAPGGGGISTFSTSRKTNQKEKDETSLPKTKWSCKKKLLRYERKEKCCYTFGALRCLCARTDGDPPVDWRWRGKAPKRHLENAGICV